MDYKNYLIGFLVGVVVVLGIALLRPQIISLGGTTNFSDLAVDSITNGGALTNTSAEASFAGTRNSSGTTIGGGTTVNKYSCVSLSNYNPPSLASSGNPLTNVTTTGFTVTGAAVADICTANLSSDTSTVPHLIQCRFPTANSSTVTIANNDSVALDIATGTLKVCYLN